jgi:hypothetical protein
MILHHLMMIFLSVNMEDNIVKSVKDDLTRRSEVGIKKYKTTLDRQDLTEKQWLNHAYEEALDLALYLKKLITDYNEDK